MKQKKHLKRDTLKKVTPMKKAKVGKHGMGGCSRGPEWQCGIGAKAHF